MLLTFHTDFDQVFVAFFSKKLEFTPCKAEQPLQGMWRSTIKERKRSTKRLTHNENLFRKNLQSEDVC